MMPPAYHATLAALRQAFPQPVSDPVHDSYVVFTILRALDQVDALKSQSPILGSPVELDFHAARHARMVPEGVATEEVVRQLVTYLEGMFNWGHPRSQINVVCPPSIASIIGVLLPATYNPNLCSDESSRRFSEAEVRVSSMAADLIGFDPQASAGVFTFGGTGTLLYGVKVGLEKAIPGALKRGVSGDVVVFTSEAGHYACHSVAAWLGIGQDQVVRVPTDDENAVDIAALEAAASEAIERGARIAAIIATMGSTDAFGIDDLAAVRRLRDRLVTKYALDYTPHIHADAVIGWAWSVFRDYDFGANPLGFRGRTVRALAAARRRLAELALADSVGFDFHKTGYTPYVSSLVLMRDKADFALLQRSRATMPYLFQTGEYHPGTFTLETTRSATGPMAALASLLLLGKDGLRTLIGHAVDMAEVLREEIQSRPPLSVLGEKNCGPVTLFRAYPDGVDTFDVKQREMHDPEFRETVKAHNQYNREIYRRVHAEALAGRGVTISMTDCFAETAYNEPLVALKSYVLSPFAEAEQMAAVVTHVMQARASTPFPIALGQ